MREPTCHRQPFRLGSWDVDPEASRIRGPHSETKLDYKAMHVLALLAEHAESTVSREAIFDHVWADTIVTDEVLTVAISALRRALGDDAKNPTFIRTFPKRGYRLLVRPSAIEPRTRAGSDLRRAAIYGSLAVVAVVATLLVAKRQGAEAVSGPSATAAAAMASDPRAHELYLKARYLRHRGIPDSLAAAFAAVEEAIARSPRYAPAHALMAEVLILQVEGGTRPIDAGFGLAREAAARALELDPGLAAAHAATAIVAFGRDWDFELAERAFGRALEDGSDDLFTLKWYVRYLVVTGRADVAIDVAQRIRRIDPHSFVNLLHVHALDHAGRYDAALERLQEIERLMPSEPGIHAAYANIYLKADRNVQAVASLLALADAVGWPETQKTRMREAFSSGGAEAVYRHLAGERSPFASPAIRAKLHAKLGQDEQALDLLEAAVAARDMNVLWIGADRSFDRLRSNERFQAIIEQVGLANPS